MAERGRVDVVSSADAPAPAAGVPLTRVGSAIATALAVQLLVAVAVVEDRRSAGPTEETTRESDDGPTAGPTPSASRSPEVITAAEGAARRRIAVNTARFTASQVCADSESFVFDVVETSQDVIETVISAHDPADVSGITVKVTLLQGGYAVSYQVLDERGTCDA